MNKWMDQRSNDGSLDWQVRLKMGGWMDQR